METTYSTTHETGNRRVRWVYDDSYEPSYALDTEEETRKAEEWELERLNSGELVALGAIVETKCQSCGGWFHHDSLWGIVVPPDEDLTAFGNESLDIPGERPWTR